MNLLKIHFCTSRQIKTECMKRLLISTYLLFLTCCFVLNVVEGFSQNVGLGTTTPGAPLHIRRTGLISEMLRIEGLNPYISFYESNVYRGYVGSFSGNAEDVDFGTGTGTTGKLHLTIGAIPKLTISNTGNVGIGTTDPHTNANLHIALGSSSTNGFLVTGTNHNGLGTVPNLGGGARMMFWPGQVAFRAGSVISNEWDHVNIGYGSTAIGYNPIASGDFSFALGVNAVASGVSSFVLGGYSVSSGDNAVAIGLSATSSGFNSIAIGPTTTASGDRSVAIGNEVSTSNQEGSFIFGDSDPHFKGTTNSVVNDEFVARFNGGYYFISSNSGINHIGVRVLPGANSWSAISDSKLKENFAPVHGENFLFKISQLNLGTWNYIGQDPKSFRHYGPMAQEFFKAFGKDSYGTIGCDTLINQHDFLGVNLIAIQALEKRTTDLKETLDSSFRLIDELRNQNELLIKRIELLERTNK